MVTAAETRGDVDVDGCERLTLRNLHTLHLLSERRRRRWLGDTPSCSSSSRHGRRRRRRRRRHAGRRSRHQSRSPATLHNIRSFPSNTKANCPLLSFRFGAADQSHQ